MKKKSNVSIRSVTIESFVKEDEKEKSSLKFVTYFFHNMNGRSDTQREKEMPENSLKNKRFILFLYRKAIKKQFAVCARKFSLRADFPHLLPLLLLLAASIKAKSAICLYSVSPPHRCALLSIE